MSDPSTKKLPDYNLIDAALNDAYCKAHPLSSLQKPTITETKDAIDNGEA
jgi:hypothetical protein